MDSAVVHASPDTPPSRARVSFNQQRLNIVVPFRGEPRSHNVHEQNTERKLRIGSFSAPAATMRFYEGILYNVKLWTALLWRRLMAVDNAYAF